MVGAYEGRPISRFSPGYQRGLGVAGRRTGFVAISLHVAGLQYLTLSHIRESRVVPVSDFSLATVFDPDS